MNVARVRVNAEQWFEPPEPILDRYLLRSRRRAANDNRRRSIETFRSVQIATCVALIGAISLLAL